MGQMGHAAHMEEMGNTYKNSVGIPEGNLGRPRCRQKVNTKILNK
jgi:hypothetical protein